MQREHKQRVTGAAHQYARKQRVTGAAHQYARLVYLVSHELVTPPRPAASIILRHGRYNLSASQAPSY